jgi:hypothetical protein
MTAPPPLLRAFPQRPPTTHLERRGADGRFAGPACGQRALDGSSFARTLYAKDPARVTCKKCRAAIERSARAAATA